MNCTAWNSVCAKALDEEPERRTEHGVGDRDQPQQPDRAGDVEAERPDAERDRREPPVTVATTPKASA